MTAPQDNSAQKDYWNADAGKSWARFQTRLDAAMAPIADLLLEGFAPPAGSHILDVGCGTGAVSLALAGRGCVVTGIDISTLLLEVARERSAAAGAAVTWLEQDAALLPPRQPPFDAMISRFGVMFFADPAAAFAQLRQSLKPGGAFRFVCWGAPERNAWTIVPMAALMPLFPAPPPPGDPLAPGPFAFADDARVRGLLEQAGFRDIMIEGHETAMIAGTGPDALEQAVQFYSKIGPAAALLRETDEDTRTIRAPEALRQALAPFLKGDAVRLPAAIWRVEARK